jgi:hypothetical protein
MKTSAVLASLLFGSFAVAAPVDRRALVYKTEVVTETVVVYTTVYDDEPVPAATTTEGAFYEQPKPVTSAVVEPSSSAAPKTSAVPAPAPTTEAAPSPEAPAYTPSVPAVEPSSVFTPPAPETPEPTPEPQPEPEAPKPSTTKEAPAPAPTSVSPAPTSAAPAEYPAAPATGNTGGAEFTNVDITIYDNNGGLGACGTELHDSSMIVALAKDAWGASTYDTMTGKSTNPWCGQKIKIDYEGNSIEATIQDLCPGCSGNDIDLSLAAWKQLTGLDEKTRLKASWSKIN